MGRLNLYRVVGALGPGLIRIEHAAHGKQLWTRGKVRGRAKQCAVCRRILDLKQLAYHPFTNAMNRMDRLCVRCAETKETHGTSKDDPTTVA